MLTYEVHQSNLGWLEETFEGDICGDYQSSNQIEAIRLSFEQPSLNIFYSVCGIDGKWNNPQCNGLMAGTTGKRIPLRDIKIWLEGKTSNLYKVRYKLHCLRTGAWSAWAYDGASTNLGERWNGVIVEVLNAEHNSDGK